MVGKSADETPAPSIDEASRGNECLDRAAVVTVSGALEKASVRENGFFELLKALVGKKVGSLAREVDAVVDEEWAGVAGLGLTVVGATLGERSVGACLLERDAAATTPTSCGNSKSAAETSSCGMRVPSSVAGFNVENSDSKLSNEKGS